MPEDKNPYTFENGSKMVDKYAAGKRQLHAALAREKPEDIKKGFEAFRRAMGGVYAFGGNAKNTDYLLRTLEKLRLFDDLDKLGAFIGADPSAIGRLETDALVSKIAQSTYGALLESFLGQVPSRTPAPDDDSKLLHNVRDFYERLETEAQLKNTPERKP